jgi:hypothetical protein
LVWRLVQERTIGPENCAGMCQAASYSAAVRQNKGQQALPQRWHKFAMVAVKAAGHNGLEGNGSSHYSFHQSQGNLWLAPEDRVFFAFCQSASHGVRGEMQWIMPLLIAYMVVTATIP